jgi:hypothetical protein
MRLLFYIDGFWNDDGEKFTNRLVASDNNVLDDDEDIFFNGLSEDDINSEIICGGSGELEFTITNYKLA